MQPSEKSLSAPGKPKASTIQIAVYFPPEKALPCRALQGLFYVSVPYHPPTAKACPKLRLFCRDGGRPPGAFLYDKFGKDECSCAFAKPNAHLQGCTLCGRRRFFDRMQQPVLACGEDTLQIGTGRDFPSREKA